MKGLKKWFELPSTTVRGVLAMFGAGGFFFFRAGDGQGDAGIHCGGKAAITARWEGQAVPDTLEVDDISGLFPEAAAPPEAAP